ncbi:Fe-S cluster assembly iron-binding protein IscA [Anoxybacillus tepidamans]|uniref:Fe-S cluster assembly iron-binding protein IscA n=1 Tax=Anoxybacteroides tepidamans TaxID=265948 RepID=A0A7W8MT17_9BACL|nr:iron-sulfur cluster biosynthesis family protein [Anoxybacillus tepidamans]MBB5322947.1 Fe-S cluster assembly iron-binding protein IscA [Anoxybacillus tepidamans]
MTITTQAKYALEEILKEYGKEGIRLSITNGDGDPEIALSLDEPQPTDRIETINGIQVAMDEQAMAILENIMLDVEETEEGLQLILVGL